MKKPLSVLKDMVREYEVSIKEINSSDLDDDGRETLRTSLDESIFATLPMNSFVDESSLCSQRTAGTRRDLVPHKTIGTNLPADASTPSMHEFIDYVDDQETYIWDDTLYGLFDSSMPFG